MSTVLAMPKPREGARDLVGPIGPSRRHRIVIVGGGVAGIEVATALSRIAPQNGICVTLIDREPAHVWKPMLHTIAAGTSDISQQETPYIAHARRNDYVFEAGEMQALDRGGRAVRLGPVTIRNRIVLPERDIGYDTLILALGSQANDFGLPGVREHCFMLDSRSQALTFNREVQARILQSAGLGSGLRIAVVGAGATGVELSAELIQLAEMAEHLGAARLRERLRVTLIETGPQVLAAFPDCVARASRARLEKLGITVLTETRVVAAEQTGFILSDGGQLPADLMVWAAGVKGPQVFASLAGLEVTRNLQLVVGPNLQTTRDTRVFVIGDSSCVRAEQGQIPPPPTAQVAHQQAAHLVRHLPNWLKGRPLPPFTFQDFGAIVSLGGYGAYGSLGRFGLFSGGFIRGHIAQLGHIFLLRAHQARLHGFWRGSLLWLADRINAWARPRLPSPGQE